MLGIDAKIRRDTVLFFDMDGTLVDTNLANFLSYEKAIHSIIKAGPNLIYNPNKRFNRTCLQDAVPNLSKIEYDRIVQEKEEIYRYFLPEARLNKGIADILFAYSKTNRIALVTNCVKDRTLTTLKHFGLIDRFSELVYREVGDGSEEANKFQKAISRMCVSPDLVIAFENEEAEIAKAKGAGIKIINPELI